MSPTRTHAARRPTSTNYRAPHRPAVLRLANRVLGALQARGAMHVSLEESSLFEAAEAQTGLLDLGAPDFRAPMRALLAAIEDEARLHPLGRLITRTRMVSTLVTRMRLEEQFRTTPALRTQTLGRPIVIVGLPRTGTTLLHRLLAGDPRLRALASWEALNPVPLPGPDERARRVAFAERSAMGLRFMAPDFFAVHPIDPRAPEEDVLLLDLAFQSTVAESTLRVPSYARWLEAQDQTPAYRMLVRTLQSLSHQAQPESPQPVRWVLKTPHHMEWLETLDAALPGALFVWTHRAPSDVVPSFCSMLAHGRGVFSDDVDPHEVGRDWLRKGTRMMTRAMEARARLGEDRFLDVPYGALLADPLAVARAIEERAGLTWTRDTETRMRDLLRVEVQHRHGVHRYRLQDFGLSEGEVARAFGDYQARFEHVLGAHGTRNPPRDLLPSAS